jgi:hypothetical protein
MRRVAQVVSLIALVATIAPAILYFTQTIELDTTKLATNIATLVWFVATPLWMGRRPAETPGAA